MLSHCRFDSDFADLCWVKVRSKQLRSTASCTVTWNCLVRFVLHLTRSYFCSWWSDWIAITVVFNFFIIIRVSLQGHVFHYSEKWLLVIFIFNIISATSKQWTQNFEQTFKLPRSYSNKTIFFQIQWKKELIKDNPHFLLAFSSCWAAVKLFSFFTSS